MSWATMSKAERREAVTRGAAEGASASRLARQYDTAIGAIEAVAERAGIEFPVSPERASEKVGGVAGACSASMRREPDEDRAAAPMPAPGPSNRQRLGASPWTPERIERAQTMWRDGESAATIAAALGGVVSRSAVIGQAHRSGWPVRQTRSGQSTVRTPVPPKVRSTGQTSPNPPRPKSPPPAPRRVALPRPDLGRPLSRAIPLLELSFEQCRFPDGGRDEPARTFCGHEAWTRVVGRERRTGPWCEYHARICYQPLALRAPRGAQ